MQDRIHPDYETPLACAVCGKPATYVQFEDPNALLGEDPDEEITPLCADHITK